MCDFLYQRAAFDAHPGQLPVAPSLCFSEVTLQGTQLRDLGVDEGELLFEQIMDMGAGLFSCVAQQEQFANLAQGETQRLGLVDETEVLDGGFFIEPEPAFAARGLCDQTLFLVKADCVYCQPATRSNGANL